MPRKTKAARSVLSITTSRDLRLSLIQTYQDLLAERITPHEARARAVVARAILDTVRTELMLARTNLESYRTIDLTTSQYSEVREKSN